MYNQDTGNAGMPTKITMLKPTWKAGGGSSIYSGFCGWWCLSAFLNCTQSTCIWNIGYPLRLGW